MQVRQSFISAWLTHCQRQAYLSYVEELPYLRSSALFIGDLLHRTMEHMFEHPSSLAELVEYYSRQFYLGYSKDLIDLGDLTPAQARMIGMNLVTIYYPVAKQLRVKATEVEGFVELGSDSIITHIDFMLENKTIIELKSARVLSGRYGEYFPDYSDKSVRYKPQAMIHRLIWPEYRYFYHVVGKGQTELVGQFEVLHSQEFLERFKRLTLEPALAQIKSGYSLALTSPLCNYCPWARDIKHCGALL